MKINKYYFIFLWCVLVFTVILFTIKIEIDKKEINRLEKQNKELYIKVHNYEWMTQQYEYMFNKYCGCDNK